MSIATAMIIAYLLKFKEELRCCKAIGSRR